MAKNAYMAIYFVLMVAAIIGADVLFFRNRFLARLVANIAIVAVFAAVYFLVLEKPLSRAQPLSCVEEDCGSLPLRLWKISCRPRL